MKGIEVNSEVHPRSSFYQKVAKLLPEPSPYNSRCSDWLPQRALKPKIKELTLSVWPPGACFGECSRECVAGFRWSRV